MRGYLLACLLLLGACSGSEALVRPTQPTTAPWRITDPRAFALKMPDELFRGRLAQYPSVDRCHTQGLAIVDGQVVISCAMSNPRYKSRQSFAATSLVMSAPLDKIEDDTDTIIPWQVVNLTETVPLTESPRIAQALLSQLPEPVAWFIQWFYAPEKFAFKMGHPSGLSYDAQAAGLWVSNAVYGPNTYSRLRRLDPHTLRPEGGEHAMAVRDHLGAVLALPHHLLLTSAWGDPKNFRLFDMENKRSRLLSLSTDDVVHYQDCDRWDTQTILCVGKQVHTTGIMHENRGRLHAIHIKGDSYDDLALEDRGAIEWHQADRLDTIDLGQRLYYYIEGLGDIEQGPLNHYGDFQTTASLGQEGFAVGPDHDYVYFLPADLPAGKLIRMRLESTNP